MAGGGILTGRRTISDCSRPLHYPRFKDEKMKGSKQIAQIKPSDIAAVDLFCGAGGLTHGLVKAGLNVKAGIDIDEICKYAYESNNKKSKFICKKVEDVTGEELSNLWGDASLRLLAGCAPCQPFSTYSQGKNPTDDERFPLLLHFERLVRETLPEFVTMENVPNVAQYSVFDRFRTTLEQLNYKVWSGVVECPNVGVPQSRKRMVLLASNITSSPPNMIYPTLASLPTVREAFKKLPKLEAGEVHGDDFLHRCQSLSPLNKKRMKASIPGGTWRDWPADLVLECHKRKSGKGYASVYGRMQWDQPGPTITTQCYNYGSGRFGHPEQDRPISLREAALIQSFPRKYKFDSPEKRIPFHAVARMIGNAVPVLLGKAVGISIIESIKND